MATITAEVLDLEHKQDTRGRRISDESRREAVLAGYPGSGLTQKAYARREGINYHTLVAWLGQVRRERGESPRRRTTPVTTPGPARFAEVSLGAPAPRLEVVLPDGMIVRGIDPVALLTLIRGLKN
jgi:transposase-like protein